MRKNKVHSQAVFNRLSLKWLPKELRNLRRLNSSCGKKNFIQKGEHLLNMCESNIFEAQV